MKRPAGMRSTGALGGHWLFRAGGCGSFLITCFVVVALAALAFALVWGLSHP